MCRSAKLHEEFCIAVKGTIRSQIPLHKTSYCVFFFRNARMEKYTAS